MQSHCHSQLKDDSPVGEEEEVREAGPVHPYKDVRVVGDLQLHQKWNIPERHTRDLSPVLSFHDLGDAGQWQRLQNSPKFVIHHVDLQVGDRLERVHQLGTRDTANRLGSASTNHFTRLFMQEFRVNKVFK